jgi:hypothetical protein
MHQFGVLTGLLAPALLLNTIASFLSIFLIAALPSLVNSSALAYAWIILVASFSAWLVLTIGGIVILRKEWQGDHASTTLKLGVFLSSLFLLTVVFILSCILLSVFQSDLQDAVIQSRNVIASILSLTFVAWVLVLAINYLVVMRTEEGDTMPSVKQMSGGSSTDPSCGSLKRIFNMCS